ncbi:DUF5666 domain-containing protein [Variovorax sp. RA8]|uniref:DUF5666 domain-containing protein n=1 Tax=Variovorax sp. (strain JCM 16519 / RA8) TaxID=662548 RepID=UPI001316E51B|nr:DUF5666 domain-containing protein [Variovorax sp. RA8]VTU31454.1 hypothetical protein RA8CHR_04364 [Variovorax sp. RA8]
MKNSLVRSCLIAASMTLLLSCGGGSDGGSFAPVGASGVSSGTAFRGLYRDASGGDGRSASEGGSTSADGASAPDGTDAADGSGTSDGSTTTAAGGEDSGVGSGGTGVSTADAVGIGGVDGLGSIIVNGLRYDTDSAIFSVEDAPALQIGMTAKVTGPFNADFTSGVAKHVASAAELRGPIAGVDLAGGSFSLMGTTVTTDEATVWATATGLTGLLPGAAVQVWGLPAAPGVLRATRVEQHPANSAPIATGTVQNLNTGSRVFTLGSLSVDYGTASFRGGIDASTLANGAIVRVRAAAQATPGVLSAMVVEAWHTVPQASSTPVQLAGIITDYAALASFRLLGTTVDAASAQITGGPANAIGNGVKVEVGGTMTGGVLVATKLMIRHVPGTGGPASFKVIGPVAGYSSPASFLVRGQQVDASGPGVAFVNGTVANLFNGARVTVSGSQIVNGVLVARQVSFD